MNNVFYIGATGLRAQQVGVDVVANNVANVNTPGYKRNAVAFSEMVGLTSAVDPAAGLLRSAAEPGLGVVATAAPKVLDAGDLRKTDSALDLAVRGAGFIELLAPGGQTLMWRGGTLRVNSDGALAAANGLPLKGSVSVPRDATGVLIAESGQVFATTPGNASAQPIGQIELVAVRDERALTALGDGLYQLTDALADSTRGQPGEAGLGLLAQGYLETSNVKMVDEMVGMLLMQRAYSANARILQAADEMMNTVNQLRR